MFKSMGQGTLSHYEENLFYKKPENMNRYLMSYNDLIYLFINTGKPKNDITISEHIFISKTPSAFISNLYENNDKKALSVKLHLNALKQFKPDYVFSQPLDIMSDIFEVNFVKKGLFTKQPRPKPWDIFGYTFLDLKFGVDPSVEFAVNHEVLNKMLTEQEFLM